MKAHLLDNRLRGYCVIMRGVPLAVFANIRDAVDFNRSEGGPSRVLTVPLVGLRAEGAKVGAPVVLGARRGAKRG